MVVKREEMRDREREKTVYQRRINQREIKLTGNKK